MDARTIADCLLHATAQQDAAKASVDAYREALTDVFRDLHQTHGIRGSIDTDAGKARWDTPDPEPVITDELAFYQWQATATPELRQVTITIPANEVDIALAVLDREKVTYSADWTIRATDKAAVLANLQATDDGQAVTPAGEVVPGVEWRDKPARLVVTVDSGLKTEQRRRAREAVIAEVAAE